MSVPAASKRPAHFASRLIHRKAALKWRPELRHDKLKPAAHFEHTSSAQIHETAAIRPVVSRPHRDQSLGGKTAFDLNSRLRAGLRAGDSIFRNWCSPKVRTRLARRGEPPFTALQESRCVPKMLYRCASAWGAVAHRLESCCFPSAGSRKGMCRRDYSK